MFRNAVLRYGNGLGIPFSVRYIPAASLLIWWKKWPRKKTEHDVCIVIMKWYRGLSSSRVNLAIPSALSVGMSLKIL